MYFSTATTSTSLTLTLLFTPLTLALPAPAAKLASRSDEQWTTTGLTRTCDADLRTCTWQFGISSSADPTGTPPQDCTLVVAGTPGTVANGGPAACGIYTVTSGWAPAGGVEPFTTLSLVDYARGVIAWASFRDSLVGTDGVVVPDMTWEVQQIPS
ncbi:hypothetical protein F4778DRAFT_748172 [Xylariomycetidae sp. FL2044]|nr:hypothetical protein F4778DRAFT_748172 [Xylariomycetidae sp. FL2044]